MFTLKNLARKGLINQVSNIYCVETQRFCCKKGKTSGLDLCSCIHSNRNEYLGKFRSRILRERWTVYFHSCNRHSYQFNSSCCSLLCAIHLSLLVRDYDDVVMGAMAAQITSLAIVYSTVYSGADQRKHQSSASLAFVWGIHRGPVNSPHKWPVTRKMFPFDDVITVLIILFLTMDWGENDNCRILKILRPYGKTYQGRRFSTCLFRIFRWVCGERIASNYDHCI